MNILSNKTLTEFSTLLTGYTSNLKRIKALNSELKELNDSISNSKEVVDSVVRIMFYLNPEIQKSVISDSGDLHVKLLKIINELITVDVVPEVKAVIEIEVEPVVEVEFKAVLKKSGKK